MRQWAYPM